MKKNSMLVDTETRHVTEAGANNSNNNFLLSIGTVKAHVPKNVVHEIQKLLVEQIVFLQQALRGTHIIRFITAVSQRKIGYVTGGALNTSKILTRPL